MLTAGWDLLEPRRESLKETLDKQNLIAETIHSLFARESA